MKIIIINGPNLNLLGIREPEIYGHQRFEDYFEALKATYYESYPDLQLDYFQSNSEGLLVSKVQEAGFEYKAIILNPAAYTHTSIALADAVAAIKTPVIEVHISNPKAREEIRHISYVSKYVKGTIAGFGLDSYRLALAASLSL